MRKLDINDEEAHALINILKMVLKKYSVDLTPGNRGQISMNSVDNDKFLLNYFTPPLRDDKLSIHLREKESNINLARINIDPTGFHNNSDGQKIRGNRILLFSSEEWVKKNDGNTHVKAFEIPKTFSDTSNLEQVFLEFLLYINVKQEGKINFVGLI